MLASYAEPASSAAMCDVALNTETGTIWDFTVQNYIDSRDSQRIRKDRINQTQFRQAFEDVALRALECIRTFAVGCLLLRLLG